MRSCGFERIAAVLVADENLQRSECRQHAAHVHHRASLVDVARGELRALSSIERAMTAQSLIGSGVASVRRKLARL